MNKGELPPGMTLGLKLFKELAAKIEEQSKEKNDVGFRNESLVTAFKAFTSYLSSVFTKKELLEMFNESEFLLDYIIEDSENSKNSH